MAVTLHGNGPMGQGLTIMCPSFVIRMPPSGPGILAATQQLETIFGSCILPLLQGDSWYRLADWLIVSQYAIPLTLYHTCPLLCTFEYFPFLLYTVLGVLPRVMS